MSVIKKLNSEAIVAFHVAYAKLPGSDPMCALFLSQVSYWCARSEDGVAWITHQAMYSQTGMSRKQQDRAAAYWSAHGVMDKFIKGIPPKIHYFVYFDRLERLILDAELQQNDMSERDNLVVRNGQQVLSERGKTSREDSKEILSCVDSSQQQPESASGISITTPSQALAQAPDQPLSSRATPPPPSSAGPLPLVAETIYSHYPRKIGKADALKAIAKAVKQDGYQVILDATMEYASAVARWPDSEKQYVPHPSTWFNRASYLDDRSEWTKKCKRLPQSQSAKRFLSPAEMQAQEEAAAQNYTPGFRS